MKILKQFLYRGNIFRNQMKSEILEIGSWKSDLIGSENQWKLYLKKWILGYFKRWSHSWMSCKRIYKELSFLQSMIKWFQKYSLGWGAWLWEKSILRRTGPLVVKISATGRMGLKEFFQRRTLDLLPILEMIQVKVLTLSVPHSTWKIHLLRSFNPVIVSLVPLLFDITSFDITS